MRAEPEGVVEWRVHGGKRLAAGEGVAVEMTSSSVVSQGAFAAEEEARLTEAICALEGRVAMLTFRWPPPS